MYIAINHLNKAKVFKNRPVLRPIYKKVVTGQYEDPYGKFHDEYKTTDEILYFEFVDTMFEDSILSDSDRYGYEVDINSFNDTIKQMNHGSLPIEI